MPWRLLSGCALGRRDLGSAYPAQYALVQGLDGGITFLGLPISAPAGGDDGSIDNDRRLAS